jgi:putative FmdB family regulatory protein
MPIYEYLCSACAHTLDALQKLSEDPLVYCPQCGAAALKRQVSAPSFRLKGSGWYETDFKNDRRRNISESDSKGDEKPEKKSDGKPDKPDEARAAKAEPAGKADQPVSTEAKRPASGTPEAKKPSGATAEAKKPSSGKAGDAA